ncbi:MAG: hypothetical protein A3G20_06700 [Acidobacteria bacterium RIFCSPLOWO2_12_FULL_59_11]|nr:MAG: hypothetical protein A3G20_06700 [Acidobacteria bacterium RIFCSPLOWO2_12_FULL_59_11]
MKIRSGSVLAASLLLCASPLWSQQARQPSRPQRASIQQVLDLTDRQLAELEELRTAHQKKTQDLTSQMRDLETQRRALMKSSDGDVVKVGSIAFQVQGLQQQIEEENKSYSKELLSLLDSGQREKVEKIKEALELAPQAGALIQYGFIEGRGMGGGRAFMGPGGGFRGSMPGDATPPSAPRASPTGSNQ